MIVNNHCSLAVKYRPQTFKEVCGQTLTTTILEKMLESNTFCNCLGFFGASGTGKTTCARIFANKINNGVGEPIEIDGATAGNVDNIRLIVDSAKQRSLTGEYKVFIIDECQILGGGRKENSPAWSALLKCIEEAPKYTVFIFCSTDPEKIPTAILNRIQRYNFAPISANDIRQRLEFICQKEGFTQYQQVCELISKAANGGMRDAITYLEQIASYSSVLSLDVAKSVLGGLSYENMFKLTWALQQKDDKKIVEIIEDVYKSGQSLKVFIANYFNFVLDLVKYILFKNITITGIPEYLATEENAVVQFTVKDQNSLEYFKKLADAVLKIKLDTKFDTDAKNTVEVMLLNFGINN